MPVPATFADLSTTAASNSPSGSDNVFPDNDNHIRALASMLKSIEANTATNGWVSPYLPIAGGTLSGAIAGTSGSFSSTITAASLIPTSSSVPTNGLYLKAANNPALSSNSTLRWDVGSAGNHAFAAPSSGATLTVNGLSGAVSAISVTDGTVTSGWQASNSSIAHIGTTSNHAFNLMANASTRLSISTAGNVTINAPSSGQHRVDGVTAFGGAYTSGFSPVVNIVGSATTAFSARNTTNSVEALLTTDVASAAVGTFTNHDFKLRANNTNLVTLTTDGRFYGTALHNNAGAVTGTTNQYIASGTWTPTLTNNTNIDSSGTSVGQWTRVGNVVTWSLEFSVNATSASSNTELGISLPIASDFASTAQCVGNAAPVVAAVSGGNARIIADATNNRMSLFFTSGSDVGNSGWYASGSYLIV